MPTFPPLLRLVEKNRATQNPVLDLSYPLLEEDGGDYDYPPLLEIPPEVYRLTHLRQLNLSSNAIQIVPAELAQLDLEFIVLCKNPLREVADIPGLVLDWGHWQRLRPRPSAEHIAGLWLRWMGAASEQVLRQFPKLRWLDLSERRLSELPPAVTQLQQLSVLNLSYSRITESLK